MKIEFIILFFFFFSIACEDKKEQNTDHEKSFLSETIILTDAKSVINDTIRISEIADTLFYVQLKKTGNDDIMDINRVFIQDSSLFVYDAASFSIYMFNIDGKFIRKINDDLTPCLGLDFMQKEKHIYSASKDEIIIYDYKGKVVKKMPLPVEGIGNFIAVIDTSNIAVSIWNVGSNLNRLIIFNIDGNIVKEFENPELFNSNKATLVNASRFHRSLFRNNDSIFYQPYYSDTLFSLSNNELFPILIEGIIKKVPLEHRLEYLGNEKDFVDYCIQDTTYATRFFKSTRYFFVNYHYGFLNYPTSNYLIFDRFSENLFKYEQSFNPQKGIKLHYGIYNDYDGGLPFNIHDGNNDYLVCYYGTSKKFKRDYLKGIGLTNCKDKNNCIVTHYDIRSDVTKNNNTNENCEEFIKQLEENNNPILMILKLKIE